MTLQDLIAFDGKLELYAWDGHFLGLLSSDCRDPNSIINLNTYGNVHTINSIYYKYGIYGGRSGKYSPYNQYCLYPPKIVFQQQVLGLVSKNKYIQNNDLTIIDPDEMTSIYTDLSSQLISFNIPSLIAA